MLSSTPLSSRGWIAAFMWLAGLIAFALSASLSSLVNAVEPTRLSGLIQPGGGVTNFQVSANSQNAVFRGDLVTNNVFELWSAPVNGSTARTRIADGTALGTSVDDDFQITPDSISVVFRQQRVVNPSPAQGTNFDLWIVPINGTAAPVSLGAIASGDAVLSFKISPTGNRIVFLKRASARFVLFSVPLTGGAPTEISGTFGAGISPTVGDYEISPNGARVVFLANKENQATKDLYSVAIGGGSVTRISGTPLAVGRQIAPFSSLSDAPAFRISPDSTFVVFRSDATTVNKFELSRVGIASNSPVEINSGEDVSVGPYAISKNSQSIVFGARKLLSIPSATPSIAPTLLSSRFIGGVVRGFVVSDDSAKVVFRGIDLMSVVPTLGGAVSELTDTDGPVGGSNDRLWVVSPDSARIVFYGVDSISSVSISGGLVTKLVDRPNDVAGLLSFTPNSRRVLLRSIAPGLYSSNTLAGATRISGALVAGGTIGQTVMTPDGQRAVFVADKYTDNFFELFSVPIDGGGAALDIDGDGDVLPTTDVLLLSRYQLGMRGAALIASAVNTAAATRTTFEDIEAYIVRVLQASAP